MTNRLRTQLRRLAPRALVPLAAWWALPGAIQGQRLDPRGLVVMLEWHDYAGITHRGAGIILDQGDNGSLIVTAKHNLVDPVEGIASRQVTVEFRGSPGARFAAEILQIPTSHDIGLVRVAARDAPVILGDRAPAQVLNLNANTSNGVFVVGYGGGVPWSHNVAPVPAQSLSVAEMRIESSEQQQGQSGGGVFDADWGLIGMVVATEGSVARALPIGLVLDEVRKTRYGVALAPSEDAVREAARRDLAGRNIAWSAASVGNALAAADLEVLQRFIEAGADVGLIAEGLSREATAGNTVARVFFERTRGNPAAAQWLRTAIRAGLDPNGTVPSPSYGRSGLLHLAIATGNTDAATALLEGGASPHAFQDLWLTPWPIPQMLFPLDPVIRHNVLTREEKRALIDLMRKRGAIVPSLTTVSRRFGQTYHIQALDELPNRARTIAGVEITPDDPQDMGATPVCRFASDRDRFDWCSFARNVPRLIRTDPGKMLHDFWHLELVGLIHVLDGRAYFLGIEKETYNGAVSLVEVSRDMRLWRVYRYMSPQAAMGLCREVDGHRASECWRRIDMSYHPEDGRMMVEDYYPYSAITVRGG